jgi:hypothetical protein
VGERGRRGDDNRRWGDDDNDNGERGGRGYDRAIIAVVAVFPPLLFAVATTSAAFGEGLGEWGGTSLSSLP